MSTALDLDARAAVLDERLRERARQRRRLDWQLAVDLLLLHEERLFGRLGCASVAEYASRVLGFERRKTQTLLQLARQAREWPALRERLEAGQLGYTKAREVLRVATEHTVAEWADWAAERTCREVETTVRHTRLGEPPPDRPVRARDPELVTLVFRDVRSVDAERIRAALAACRDATGLSDREFDRGQALADLCARELERAESETDGPTAGRSAIVVHYDSATGRVTGEDAEVSEAVVDEVRCDHVVVDMTDGPERGTERHSIPPRVARAVRLRDHRRCTVPGCDNWLYVHLHHLDEWNGGGCENTEDNLCCLCSQHHRLVHEGRTGAERLGDGRLRFTFADRVQVRELGALDLAGTGRPRGRASVARLAAAP